MAKQITSTFYNNVKKSAKKLKKSLCISHSKALELASQQAGYPTFYSLDKAYKNKIPTQADFIQDVRRFLINFVGSEYGNKVIEKNRTMISGYHQGAEDIHSMVLSKLLDVFDHGVDDDGTNINAGWSVVNWCLCKETIKEIGYHYIQKESIEDKIKGNLLVSMGHFFRSTADSYQSRRLVHPNFIIYVADWIRSIGADDECQPVMLKMYSENENNGLAEGVTYWKANQ
ncbi:MULTISPECIES: hypothetical protein [unclassified Alteromonas]|uniref:hypothetical protein n=1 Tax=unclassified Alteromonas TaxID=2614992 RepID=UPI0005097176|nr:MULTISPECIES: hypothetical protein [unclassified Alteromonas]